MAKQGGGGAAAKCGGAAGKRGGGKAQRAAGEGKRAAGGGGRGGGAAAGGKKRGRAAPVSLADSPVVKNKENDRAQSELNAYRGADWSDVEALEVRNATTPAAHRRTTARVCWAALTRCRGALHTLLAQAKWMADEVEAESAKRDAQGAGRRRKKESNK